MEQGKRPPTISNKGSRSLRFSSAPNVSRENTPRFSSKRHHGNEEHQRLNIRRALKPRLARLPWPRTPIVQQIAFHRGGGGLVPKIAPLFRIVRQIVKLAFRAVINRRFAVSRHDPVV